MSVLLQVLQHFINSRVERELSRLENEGLLSKVDTGEWSSPIVPVMKPNGSVRIYGDFKTTVNSMLNDLILPIKMDFLEPLSTK
jgi:hypothetical protein